MGAPPVGDEPITTPGRFSSGRASAILGELFTGGGTGRKFGGRPGGRSIPGPDARPGGLRLSEVAAARSFCTGTRESAPTEVAGDFRPPLSSPPCDFGGTPCLFGTSATWDSERLFRATLTAVFCSPVSAESAFRKNSARPIPETRTPSIKSALTSDCITNAPCGL